MLVDVELWNQTVELEVVSLPLRMLPQDKRCCIGVEMPVNPRLAAVQLLFLPVDKRVASVQLGVRVVIMSEWQNQGDRI